MHDGFGNLTQRTGSGTNLSLTVNERNQITSGGASYDANGNLLAINGHALGYDLDNRLATVSQVLYDIPPGLFGLGTESYGYSVMGQRIYVERFVSSGSPYAPDWRQRELRMYGPDGSLIGEYIMKPATDHPYEEVFYPVEKMEKRRAYFAGRLVKFGTKAVVIDRLGSVIATRDTNYPNPVTRYRYYPYGEAIGTQEWDKPQFATYTRDGSSGLDDAMNRQYDRIWGRFTTPDPYQASGGPADPGSWNRYIYVQGDPVNKADPSGLLMQAPGIINGCMGVYSLGGNSWDELDCRTANGIFEGSGGGAGFSASASIPWCPYPSPVCGVWNAVRIGIGAGSLIWTAYRLYEEALDEWERKVKEDREACEKLAAPGDMTKPPGPGWEWRPLGDPKGAWTNPGTGESARPGYPDSSHPEPHWDYKGPNGTRWWKWPNGDCTKKPGDRQRPPGAPVDPSKP